MLDYVIKTWRLMGKPFRPFFIRLFDLYENNFPIRRVNRFGENAIRNPWQDIRSILHDTNIVIIDGGASTGGTLTLMKQYFPDSIIYAFEPVQYEELSKAVKKYGLSVTVFPFALGEKNTNVNINVNFPLDTSSILNQNISKIKTEKSMEVRMMTLDWWWQHEGQPRVDVLKLDLQGYELFALRGAKKLLKHVKIVYTEVYFSQVYKGQPLFCDVVSFLEKQGFVLYNLYNLTTYRDGHLGFGDALFINYSAFHILSQIRS